jgi:hypothetical protein
MQVVSTCRRKPFKEQSMFSGKSAIRGAMMASVVVGLAACGDGKNSPAAIDGERVSLSLVKNNDGGSLMLDPRTATMHIGYGIQVSVNITGPDGQPVAGAKPTWVSTDPSIVKVQVFPDSGLALDGKRAAVWGVKTGTAKVIASYNGVADTAVITIAPAREDNSSGGGTSQPRPTSFEAGIYVSNAVDSTSLALWRREPIANATVRLIRLPLATGDTIPEGVSTVDTPTLFQTLQTDAEGYALFSNVPMGRFRVEVEPPPGSGWVARSFNYGPRWVSSIRFEVRLPKQ